jgi:bacterioferritin-associated ferredoxin
MMKKYDLGDLVVCRCEGTTLRQIRQYIHQDGVGSLNALKKSTRAGMGVCQGRTCARTLELILREEGLVPAETEPYHARPPVRPVPLKNLADGAESFTEPDGPVSVVMLRRPLDENPDLMSGPAEEEI